MYLWEWALSEWAPTRYGVWIGWIWQVQDEGVMAKVSDQRCSLQLVFMSTPSKSTSPALNLLVAHINWGGRASTCFKHFNLCGFVAVMGENSWWRHSRFYTFRSLWVHSRLPYVLLRPRASVEILRMDFTKKWRGLWLITFFTEHHFPAVMFEFSSMLFFLDSWSDLLQNI